MALEDRPEVSGKPSPIFFNTPNAVSRLLAHQSPDEVFGPSFGMPLRKLNDSSLLGTGEPFHRAVVRTFETALAHDAALELYRQKFVKLADVPSYHLDDSLTPGVERDPLVPPLLDIWNATAQDARKAISDGPKHTLTQVVDSCQSILDVSSREVVFDSISKIMFSGVSTLSSEGRRYLDLLVQKQLADPNMPKKVDQLINLAQTSSIIFGIGASGDITHEILYDGNFEKINAESTVKYRAYDPDKFEIRKRADGSTAVFPKKDEVNIVRNEYREALEDDDFIPDLITGCPANAELIQAYLDRFANRARLQAVPRPSEVDEIKKMKGQLRFNGFLIAGEVLWNLSATIPLLLYREDIPYKVATILVSQIAIALALRSREVFNKRLFQLELQKWEREHPQETK